MGTVAYYLKVLHTEYSNTDLGEWDHERSAGMSGIIL